MSEQASVLVEKMFVEGSGRHCLIVDLKGEINSALLTILENIPGVDIAKKETRYNITILVGKAFNNDINRIILDVKAKCLEFFEVEH